MFLNRKVSTTIKLLIAMCVVAYSFATLNAKELQKLKVGMDLSYPPFEMMDKDGNPSGLSVDIARDLAKFLHRKLVVMNIAWEGLIPSLQTGKVDIVLSSLSITEQRKKVIDFSIPYAQSGLSLLINSKSKVQSIKDVDDKNVTVIVRKGTTAHLYAISHFKNAHIRLAEKANMAVMEVVQNKAQVFIYDPLSNYKNYKNNEKTTRFNPEPIVGTSADWGIGIKKGNTELLKSINEFLDKYKKEGNLDKLSDKYLFEIKEVFKKFNIPFIM